MGFLEFSLEPSDLVMLLVIDTCYMVKFEGETEFCWDASIVKSRRIYLGGPP